MDIWLCDEMTELGCYNALALFLFRVSFAQSAAGITPYFSLSLFFFFVVTLRIPLSKYVC